MFLLALQCEFYPANDVGYENPSYPANSLEGSGLEWSHRGWHRDRACLSVVSFLSRTGFSNPLATGSGYYFHNYIPSLSAHNNVLAV
jgi:hypothetical protein